MSQSHPSLPNIVSEREEGEAELAENFPRTRVKRSMSNVVARVCDRCERIVKVGLTRLNLCLHLSFNLSKKDKKL